MRFKSILRERKLSIVCSILFAALALTFPVQATAAEKKKKGQVNYFPTDK
jgi:hypothetical protein